MAEELIGIIGGSGLGDALGEHISDVKFKNIVTPFGKPSGQIMIGRLGKRRVAFINRHGEGHIFLPGEVPYAANIFAMKKLGVHTIISSAAVGSLREEIKPGELVIVDQFIDKTTKRLHTFFGEYGAVHCEMAEPICGRLAKMLFEATGSIGIKAHPKGTYIGMEGPQFSTRAESLMNRIIGGDLIGMTGMPEAKLAREAQICYAMVAMPTDYDCWRTSTAAKDKQTLLREIIGNLKEATNNAIKIIKAVLQRDDALCSEQCSCRKSLELAVWTEPEKIAVAKKEELKVLFE